MFERHPGCGCVITYRTGGKVYTQGAEQWQDNSWSEAREERIRLSEEDEYITINPESDDKVQVTDKQFGKKLGKHCQDFGLDPSKKEDRDEFLRITQDIIENHDEKFSGRWRAQPDICDFYIKWEDVVIVNAEKNEYITTMKGGVNNARVKNARGR